MVGHRAPVATGADADWMQESFKQMGWEKRDNYFAECCRQQAEGKLVLLAAELEGRLKPGGTVVEGTAGNTGIGLAVVANAMGFKTVIVIPDNQ